MKRRFEIEGHVDLAFSSKWFIREGTFTTEEIALLRKARKFARRHFFPRHQFKLIVEENDIGFMVVTLESETRKDVFSEPTLSEALQSMAVHLVH